MTAITAALVKELREKTDAPMMECKKALTEAAGNMERAEEILRVKLGSKAGKAASRVTAEGLIGLFIAVDGKQGAILELNCETDFVAKNDEFVKFVHDTTVLAAAYAPADVATLNKLVLGTGTVESTRAALVGKIGENMAVRRFANLDTAHNTAHKLASYVHGGRIGVLIEFSGEDEVGKDLAMHIAAAKPRALNSDGVPAEDIARERSVAELKAIESGKSAEIAAKMIDGAIAKYLKEVALMSQLFVKNDKQTIEQMLKEKGAAIHRFVLYVVGEGIEKKSDNFVDEVAAMTVGRA